MKKLMLLAPLALIACVNSNTFAACPDEGLAAQGYTLLHSAGDACMKPGMAVPEGAMKAALIGLPLVVGVVAVP